MIAICGAEDFVGIVKFAKAKRSWLRKIVDLRNGIPSHDLFNAIFAAIKPAEFERQLAELDHGLSLFDQRGWIATARAIIKVFRCAFVAENDAAGCRISALVKNAGNNHLRALHTFLHGDLLSNR